jgi:hypothetical protein
MWPSCSTTTKIYLLQFIDGTGAASAFSEFGGEVAGAPSASADGFSFSDTAAANYWTDTQGGKTTRYGVFQSGDALVLVVQSGKAGQPLAPFQQVLTLQFELLQ